MDTDAPPSRRQILFAIHGLGLTQIVGWGTTFYATTVMAAPIGLDTGWSRTEIYGALSLSLILGAFLSRHSGRALDYFGGKRAMSLGSIVAALGLTGAALAARIEVYIGAWLILGVAMRLMLYEAAFATLTAAAGAQAGRAISLLTLYGGFASTVFWPVGFALAEWLGWRGALFVYAGLNLGVCLPIHWLALPNTAISRRPDVGAASDDKTAYLTGPRRRFALILLATALALFTYVIGAMTAHQVDILMTFGLAAATAVSISSLMGVGQVGARIWQVVLAPRIDAMKLALLAVSLTPLAFLVLFTGAGVAMAILFILLQGASNGLITIVRGVVPLSLFGPKGYGELTGTIAAPSLIVSSVAPAAFAALSDYQGTKVALTINLAAVCVAFILIAVLALRMRAWRS